MCFYNGKLKSYIYTCRKFLLKLDFVSTKISNELLPYSLLGKLAGDNKIHQFIEVLTLNKELIEKPELVLTRIQDYVHMSNSKHTQPTTNLSTLISANDKNYKVLHYFNNAKHNDKRTRNKKEQFWAENPHLRLTRKDNKERRFDSKAYLSISKALINPSKPPINNKIVLNCGATHHIFNKKSLFKSLFPLVTLIALFQHLDLAPLLSYAKEDP
ncbi:hypothetical protein O181_010681 [Austropuccinia psidii MF-1]|uniref:Uncharacterized protein n=1 Tax=Austropuccinia psidii MF-1 TaxID=1389203 RepID=A0A9Q3GKM9_9BASI|nr:hypothetical protein [Austropuccinia psidii MF-1]